MLHQKKKKNKQNKNIASEEFSFIFKDNWKRKQSAVIKNIPQYKQ